MSSRERNMLIILGVIGVGALAFFLLTSGGGEPEETTAPTSLSSSPGSATSPLPVEEEGQEQEEQKEQEEALGFLGGRDPFVPLVEEATSGGEAPTDDTTVGDTTAGDTTTGDTTGDTTTGETTPGETATGDSSSGGSGSGGGSSAEEADVAFTGRPVTLVSISSRESGNVARVKVGGKTFTVREGHRFSRYFEILSVRRHCARLLLGDRPFTLCEE